MKGLLTILLAACSLAAWSQPQLVAGYTTTYDDQFETYTSTSIPLAQTFVVDQGDEFILDYIKLRLYSYDGGSYGTLTVSLYATDANDFPTGSPLSTGTMGGGITTSTAGVEYDIDMDVYTLDGGTDPAGTTYAIVVTSTGYAIFWKCDVSSTYSSGYGERYTSGAWSKTLDGNPVDFLFEVWGAIGTAPPAGGGGFKLVQPSGHLSLLIGGTAYNYVGITGTLPPNPDPPTGSIHELNAALTPGINAYGISRSDWDDDYYQDMADLGFKSVRLVSYHSVPEDLAGVKHGVDMALAAGLIPIYGPWDPAFKDDNSQENIDEFIDWMDAISDYFKDYAPNQLILELTNEPENLPYDTWNTVVADAVEAIRANDPDRPIMISPQYWGQVQGLPYLEVPADTMLIMSVHLYRPETFVWQGTAPETRPERQQWIGTEWWPILPFQDEVEEWFAPMVTWAEDHPTVACNVGEFGATKNADNASRARFANYHAWYFEEQDWSHHWWDYYNDYGVYYPDGDSTSAIIVDGLTDPVEPAVIPITATEIYYGHDFANTVGWTASTGVSLTASGGKLVATATSASSDYLDRYIYYPVSLEQFHIYRITFSVQSLRSTAVFTLGGPYMWELMSGIQAPPYTTIFDYSFTFSWNDDAAANLRFNIGGGGTTTLYISAVLVEELTID